VSLVLLASVAWLRLPWRRAPWLRLQARNRGPSVATKMADASNRNWHLPASNTSINGGLADSREIARVGVTTRTAARCAPQLMLDVGERLDSGSTRHYAFPAYLVGRSLGFRRTESRVRRFGSGCTTGTFPCG
jgi:hypothetical protein